MEEYDKFEILEYFFSFSLKCNLKDRRLSEFSAKIRIE